MQIDKDIVDREALKKVPNLVDLLNQMTALWSNPAELAKALKPAAEVMDKVTAFVNNPENHNGRS